MYAAYSKTTIVLKQERICIFQLLDLPYYIYCSYLWKPYQLCNIELIERLQKRATKYILCDYNSDYKLRLPSIDVYLWSTYVADIMFL